jgi:hypothetical protein
MSEERYLTGFLCSKIEIPLERQIVIIIRSRLLVKETKHTTAASLLLLAMFLREESGVTIATGVSTNYRVSSLNAAVIVSEEEGDPSEGNDNKLAVAKSRFRRPSILEQSSKTHHCRSKHRSAQRQLLPRSPPDPNVSLSTRIRSKSFSPMERIDRDEPGWDSAVHIVHRNDNDRGLISPQVQHRYRPSASFSSPLSSLALPLLCGQPDADCASLPRPIHCKQAGDKLSGINPASKITRLRQTALADSDHPGTSYKNGLHSANRAVTIARSLSRTSSLLAMPTKKNSPPRFITITTAANNSELKWSSPSQPYDDDSLTVDDEALPSSACLLWKLPQPTQLTHGEILRAACLQWNMPPPSPSTAEYVTATRKTIADRREELTETEKVLKTTAGQSPTDQGDEDFVLAIESANKDEDDSLIDDKRSVRFAKDLVTELQFRPKTTRDQIPQLFFQEEELEELKLDRETTIQERFECVVVESAATHYHIAIKHNQARPRRSDGYKIEHGSATTGKAFSEHPRKIHGFAFEI